MQRKDKFLVYVVKAVADDNGELIEKKEPVCRGIGIFQSGVNTRFFDVNSSPITNALFIDDAFQVKAGQLVEVGGNVWVIQQVSKHPNGSGVINKVQQLLLVFKNA